MRDILCIYRLSRPDDKHRPERYVCCVRTRTEDAFVCRVNIGTECMLNTYLDFRSRSVIQYRRGEGGGTRTTARLEFRDPKVEPKYFNVKIIQNASVSVCTRENTHTQRVKFDSTKFYLLRRCAREHA